MFKILPEEHYNLLLHLHISIRILCTPILCYSENELAQYHINQFVKGFQSLYGKEHSSYNVHGLIHLPKDVIHHGNVDSFSAFRFEDYLGKLKRLLRDPNQPIQQVHRRIIELEECTHEGGKQKRSGGPQLLYQHSTGMYPRYLDVVKEYKCAYYKEFVLNTSERDSLILLKTGKIAQCVTFCELENSDKIILCKAIRKKPLYLSFLLESSLLSLYELTFDTVITLDVIKFQDIASKCFLVKNNNFQSAALPLLHYN